ncbi:SGNH/GDSL hydrolase family protein [Micromonospora sp. HK10]|uniref:SGNH/GDSL hydrolase family protein n=1 Tax=Micromonospora sp. HK10 TaxID=1538294 RepID=UPI0009E2D9C4
MRGGGCMLGSGRIRARIPRLAEAQGDDWGTVAGDGEPLRLAVLGDSAAAGVGAPDHQTALAGQTAVALAALTGRHLSWRVVARSGATARTIRQDLVDGITDPHTRWSPHLVLVVVGVNDAVRFRRAGRFRSDVEHLVAVIRRRLGAPIPVLLAGLPPVHRFPALPAPVRLLLGTHARRLDRQLTRVARRDTNVFHLPVGHLPIERDDFFASDRFHPGPAGYRVWGRTLGAQTAMILEAVLPITMEPNVARQHDGHTRDATAEESSRS